MSFFGNRRQSEQQPPPPPPKPQAPPPAAAPSQPVGFETVLGANTTLEGTLRSNANVRLDGTFTGTLEINGNVLVGETAKINADINAKNVSIAGAVRGNVSGKKVQLLRTGRIWGDIRAAALTTEEGAFIDGKITMISQEMPPGSAVPKLEETAEEKESSMDKLKLDPPNIPADPDAISPSVTPTSEPADVDAVSPAVTPTGAPEDHNDQPRRDRNRCGRTVRPAHGRYRAGWPRREHQRGARKRTPRRRRLDSRADQRRLRQRHAD